MARAWHERGKKCEKRDEINEILAKTQHRRTTLLCAFSKSLNAIFSVSGARFMVFVLCDCSLSRKTLQAVCLSI